MRDMGRKIIYALLLTLVISCNKSDGEGKKDPSTASESSETESSENKTEEQESTQVGEIHISTGTMADLSLSNALGFNVPAQVLGKGEGVEVSASGQVAIATDR